MTLPSSNATVQTKTSPKSPSLLELLSESKKQLDLLERRVIELELASHAKSNELERLRASVTTMYATEAASASAQLLRSGWPSGVRYRTSTPSAHDRIWKDECVLTFATPFSPGGLYVNLLTLQGYGAGRPLEMDVDKGASNGDNRPVAYLHETFYKELIPATSVSSLSNSDGGAAKKLVIAPEGSDFRIVKRYALCWMGPAESSPEYDLSATDIPKDLKALVDAVVERDDAVKVTEIAQWEASYDMVPSKFAKDLIQLPNPPKISTDPKTWVCYESGMRENLWLNLSTGVIGSGRRNFDGTGGTGAAQKHFEETGRKYPLVVKLGTITPDGKADVYSYDPSEDNMVLDPYLAQHLAHFGIRVGELLKTEKSLAELEVEMNYSNEWARLSESDKKLNPLYGPGFLGLTNLGNSCYCNSLYQSLFALREWRNHFSQPVPTSIQYERNLPADPAMDLYLQFRKLGSAMADPSSVKALSAPAHEGGVDGESDVVAPKMLKTLLGREHADYSTGQQQDAEDYYRHVLDRVSRASRLANDGVDPAEWFRLTLETRTECMQSHTVSYSSSSALALELQVPVHLSSEQTAGSNPRPIVNFEACVESTLGPQAVESIEEFLSPATNQRGLATRRTTLASCPRYLVIKLRKFVVGADWQPTKLDVAVRPPHEGRVDFARYMGGKGLQAGEVAMPASAAAPAFEASPSIVESIMSMGFSREGAIRACKANNNQAEASVNWALEHMGDADFNLPLPAESAAASSSSAAPLSEAEMESVAMLQSMGDFAPGAAEFALRECGGSMERAADWLFSRSAEEIASARAAKSAVSAGSSAGPAPPVAQLPAASSAVATGYTCRAIISHIGRTTHSGHYVAHVNTTRVKGQAPSWAFFNDEKVARAENPSFEDAYIFVLERDDE